MFEKMKHVVANNLLATVVLAVAVILFLYHSGGDIIGGAIVAVSGLVAGICATVLYKAYKAAPASASKPAAKAKRKK